MAFSEHYRRPSGIYIFSSFPRAAETQFSLDLDQYVELGYEQRAGGTKNTTTGQHGCTDEEQRREELKRRRAIARKRAMAQLRPKPVETRRDTNVQTHPYFEKWDDIAVAEGTGCQTDKLPNIPALVIPPKVGKDMATQLEERDLIIFDRDVRPVVEVLVGKIMEQSLLDVMEEEELAFVRAQQRALQEILDEEQAEALRFQEQERHQREEKESKMAQHSEILKMEKETAEKIAAWAYTQQYLVDVLPAVLISLTNNGFLYDPVERDIETKLLPGLMTRILRNMERRKTARKLLDTVILHVAEKRFEVAES